MSSSARTAKLLMLLMIVIATALLFQHTGLTGLLTYEETHTIVLNESLVDGSSIALALEGIPTTLKLTGMGVGNFAITVVSGDEEFVLVNGSSEEQVALVDECVETCVLSNLSLSVMVKMTGSGNVNVSEIVYTVSKNVPTLRWNFTNTTFDVVAGKSLVLNLSEFITPKSSAVTFAATETGRISVIVQGEIMTIIPEIDFVGRRMPSVIASDGVQVAREDIIIDVIAAENITGIVESNVTVDEEIEKQLNISGEVDVVVIFKTANVSVGGVPRLVEQKVQTKVLREKLLENLTTPQPGRYTSAFDYEMTQEYETIGAVAGKVTKEGLEKLKQNDVVAEIISDDVFSIARAEALPLINATLALNVTSGGVGKTACMLDTGIDASHPELVGRVIDGVDVVNNDTDASDDAADSHGTHLAGILHAVAPNASLVAAKVCNSAGACKLSHILAGIDYCINKSAVLNIRVMTASLSDKKNHTNATCPTFLDGVLSSVANAGITFVAATGNDGYSNGVSYPACSPFAIAVGASTKQDAVAPFTNRGELLDVLAPGENVVSTAIGGRFATLSGTSVSTPFVAGAVLLRQEIKGSETIGDVKNALRTTGRVIDDFRRLDVLEFSGANVSVSVPLPNVSSDFVRIEFKEPTDLTNFSACSNLSYNHAEIDSALCLEYNKTARVWFYQLPYVANLTALKDNTPCATCENLTFNNSNIFMDVIDFSKYSVTGEEAAFQTAVSVCEDILASTTLNSSVTATGTCFNITASNLTLNCAGFTVEFDSAGLNNSNGIVARNVSNVTIKNCFIRDINISGRLGSGINLSSVDLIIVLNNSITGNGTATERGLNIFNSSNIILENNSVVIDSPETPTGFDLGASDSNITGNSIQINYTSNGQALSLGTTSPRAIIRNNTFNTTSRADTVNIGTVQLAGANFTFVNNTVFHTTQRGTGIDVAGTGLLENNTVDYRTATGHIAEGFNVGALVIRALSSFDSPTNITNNFFRAAGAEGVAGIRASSGRRIMFFNSNTIEVENGTCCTNNPSRKNATHLLFINVNNTVINNTILNGSAIWLNSTNSIINISNISFTSGNGTINFESLFIIRNLTVTQSRLNVTQNKAFLNSTNLTVFNTSAIIRLNNITFVDPFMQVDFNDDRAFEICVPPQCNERSFANNVFVFNVSSFTTYSVNDTANLTVFDETDGRGLDGFVNFTRLANQTVLFYANFTNVSNTLALNSSFANCTAEFEVAPRSLNMTFNETIQLWQVNRSFVASGTFDWNVSCSGGLVTTYSVPNTSVIITADCDGINGSLTLERNVVSSGTCFTFNCDRCFLDCAGFNVTFGQVSNNSRGIVAASRNNITVKRCNIYDGSSLTTTDIGISLTTVRNITILDTNITTLNGDAMTFLTSSSTGNITNVILDVRGGDGIDFSSATFMLVRNATINASLNGIRDLSSNAIFRNVNASSSDDVWSLATNNGHQMFDSFLVGKGAADVVFFNGVANALMNNVSVVSDTGRSVFASSANNVTLINVSARTNSSLSPLTFSNSDNGTVRNSTAENINPAGTAGEAVSVVTGSDEFLMVDSVAIANASEGIVIANSRRSQIANSTFMSGTNDAIELGATVTNTSVRRVVGTSQTQSGISFATGGRNYSISNSTFISNTDGAIEFITTASNNSFENIVLQTNRTWILTGGSASDNNITNLTFQSRNGSILLVSPRITLGTGINVSLEDVNITLNKAFINSSNFSFFNTTGVVTLNEITSTNPEPLVDFNDDTSFENCLAPQCTEISFASNVFQFNVSSFTTYSSQESAACGSNITATRTLTSNLLSNGSCFNITGNNLQLNCNNYNLTGDGSGFGIRVSVQSNITIINCRITNFSDGISFFRGHNSSILNNTIFNNTDDGIDYQSSNTSIIDGNNVSFNFDNNIVIFRAMRNNITKNIIERAEQDTFSNGLLITTNADENYVANNSINRNQDDGIRVEINSLNNSIVNNSIDHNRNDGIEVNNGTNTTIALNVIINSSDDGIEIDDTNFSRIDGNTINHSFDNNILVIKSSNNWIMNNSVSNATGDTFSNNIALNDGSSFNNITNNVVTFSQDDGVQLINSTNLWVFNNSILDNDDDGIDLSGSSEVNISSNRIFRNRFGVAFTPGQGVFIANNSFINNTDDGIFVEFASNHTLIRGNTFIDHTGSDGTAINLLGNATRTLNFTIDSNYIERTGTHGIVALNDTINLTVIDNNITQTGLAGTGRGVFLRTVFTANITDNDFRHIQDAAVLAINSTNITITTNRIDNASNYVRLEDSNDTTIINNTIVPNNQITLFIRSSRDSWIVDSRFENYSFEDAGLAFRRTGVSELKFLNRSMKQNGTNLSRDIQLNNNSVLANSSQSPGLNQSANITLFSIGFSNPRPIVDFNEDGTFETCVAPQCVEISFAAGTFLFNVSSFTNYSSQETADDVNVSITKSDLPDPVTAGNLLNYTIVLNNTGGGNASNATIRDIIPSLTTFVSSTPSPLVENDTWQLNITANTTSSINISVRTLNNISNGTIISNFANVTFVVSGDNRTTNTTQNTTVLNNNITITLAKTDNPDPVTAGNTLNYTITLNNTGFANATNITVRDILPNQTVFLSSSPSPYTSENNSWNVSITDGGITTINISVLVLNNVSNASVLVDSANVTFLSLDNTFVLNTTQNTTVLNNNITITIAKTDNPDPVTAGNTLNYTITLNNTGFANATNITVQDILPNQTIFLSSSPSPYTNENNSWNVSVTDGSVTTINISVRTLNNISNGTVLSNFANATFVVSGENRTVNTTQNTTVLNNNITITLAKTDNPDPVTAGNTLNYTITLNNTGFANATNITVRDILPNQTVFLSSSPSPYTSENNSWNVSVTDDSVTTINISVLVLNNVSNASVLVDIANVTFISLDNTFVLNTTQNTSVNNNNVTIGLSKTSATTIFAGQQLVYTISLNNTGFANATVTVRDLIPSQTTFVSSAPNPSVENDTWIVNLTENASSSITLTVLVGAGVQNGTDITNFANASFAQLGQNVVVNVTQNTTVLTPPFEQGGAGATASVAAGSGVSQPGAAVAAVAPAAPAVAPAFAFAPSALSTAVVAPAVAAPMVAPFAPVVNVDANAVVCGFAQNSTVAVTSTAGESLKIPAGYERVSGPFALGCNGQIVDLTVNVPDTFTDVKALRCTGDVCTDAISSASENFSCPVIKNTWSREPIIPIIGEGMVVNDAHRIVERAGVRVEFTGDLPSLAIRPRTPSFVPQLNPGLAFVGSPVAIGIEAGDERPLSVRLIVEKREVAVENGSESLFALVNGSWKRLGEVPDSSEGMLIDDLRPMLDTEGVLLLGVAGVRCTACGDSVFRKVYDGGSRDAVVLVHGLLNDPDTFALVVEELRATKMPVQAWVLEYPSSSSVRKTARELAGALELHVSEFDSVSLVGHSLGGFVVQDMLEFAVENRYSAVDKVKKVVLLGSPNEGTPALDVLQNYFSFLSNDPHAPGVFNINSDIVTNLKAGLVRERVEGVEYYVVAGSRPYEFNLDLFSMRLSDLLNLTVPNDGITTTRSAQRVGRSYVNNSCKNYYEVNLTHSDLVYHPLVRRVVGRIISEDITSSLPKVGFNQYVQVRLDKCVPNERIVIVGRRISSDTTSMPLGCGCGNGVCGIDETMTGCPIDCARTVVSMESICRTLPFIIWALIAINTLLTAAYMADKYVHGHVRRMKLQLASASTLIVTIALNVQQNLLCKTMLVLTYPALAVLAFVLGVDTIVTVYRWRTPVFVAQRLRARVQDVREGLEYAEEQPARWSDALSWHAKLWRKFLIRRKQRELERIKNDIDLVRTQPVKVQELIAEYWHAIRRMFVRHEKREIDRLREELVVLKHTPHKIEKTVVWYARAWQNFIAKLERRRAIVRLKRAHELHMQVERLVQEIKHPALHTHTHKYHLLARAHLLIDRARMLLRHKHTVGCDEAVRLHAKLDKLKSELVATRKHVRVVEARIVRKPALDSYVRALFMSTSELLKKLKHHHTVSCDEAEKAHAKLKNIKEELCQVRKPARPSIIVNAVNKLLRKALDITPQRAEKNAQKTVVQLERIKNELDAVKKPQKSMLSLAKKDSDRLLKNFKKTLKSCIDKLHHHHTDRCGEAERVHTQLDRVLADLDAAKHVPKNNISIEKVRRLAVKEARWFSKEFVESFKQARDKLKNKFRHHHTDKCTDEKRVHDLLERAKEELSRAEGIMPKKKYIRPKNELERKIAKLRMHLKHAEKDINKNK